MVLRAIDDLVPCSGHGFNGFSDMCSGAISKGIRCNKCKSAHKNEMKKKNRLRNAKAKDRKKESIKRSKRIYKLTTSNKKLKLQVRF